MTAHVLLTVFDCNFGIFPRSDDVERFRNAPFASSAFRDALPRDPGDAIVWLHERYNRIHVRDWLDPDEADRALLLALETRKRRADTAHGSPIPPTHEILVLPAHATCPDPPDLAWPDLPEAHRYRIQKRMLDTLIGLNRQCPSRNRKPGFFVRVHTPDRHGRPVPRNDLLDAFLQKKRLSRSHSDNRLFGWINPATQIAWPAALIPLLQQQAWPTKATFQVPRTVLLDALNGLHHHGKIDPATRSLLASSLSRTSPTPRRSRGR